MPKQPNGTPGKKPMAIGMESHLKSFSRRWKNLDCGQVVIPTRMAWRERCLCAPDHQPS